MHNPTQAIGSVGGSYGNHGCCGHEQSHQPQVTYRGTHEQVKQSQPKRKGCADSQYKAPHRFGPGAQACLRMVMVQICTLLPIR